MDAGEMTFGIEIECVVPAAALRARGWSVGSHLYGRPIPGHGAWVAKRDGSIEKNPGHICGCVCEECCGLITVEVVSPKLQGEAGLASLRAMVADLVAMGARTNKTCGLHVHVGCPEDLGFIRRLVCLVANVEKGIYAVTGTRRREGGPWCGSVKETHKPFGESGTRDALSLAASNRYHILNLAPLVAGTRRAVEFRAFEGTTNIDRITSYLFLCLGMVQYSLANTRVLPWEPKPLTAKSSIRRGGEGETQANRIFRLLGWNSGYDGSLPRAGVIGPADLKALQQEMLQLAAAYDRGE
jgi:hypothetical protein